LQDAIGTSVEDCPMSCWTPARRELLAWFKRNAPSLAELYEGSVTLIYQQRIPGRTRFIAHAVREIRNRLPEVIAGGEERKPRVDYENWVTRIEDNMRSAGLSPKALTSAEEFASGGDAVQPATREVPVDLLTLLAEFVASHHGVKETRAFAAYRMFEKYAPENRDLQKTLLPVIQHWLQVTEWFMARAHDSGKTDEQHDETRLVEQFESQLNSLVRAFFTSIDELDHILAAPDLSLVDRAISLIGRAEQYRYFFDKLNDPSWAKPLAAKGFFKQPPDFIPTKDGQYFRVPPWSETQ